MKGVAASFWCVDCQLPVRLNVHGLCEHCGGGAVDTMERPNRMQPEHDKRRADWKRELEREMAMAVRKEKQ